MSIHLYLSPHLDDAALSCAGRMAGQIEHGETVRVLNVFAGVPDYTHLSAYAERQHTKWGRPTDPVGTRRAEDERTLRGMGAEVENWDLYDCIYRQADGHFLYTAHDEAFGPIHPAEEPLVARLADEFVARGGDETTLYAPLGAGGHVDHRLVRAAALAAHARGADVVFYEDFPYAARGATVEAALSEVPDNWVSELVPIDVERKIAVIAGYASQLFALFGDATGMERDVRAYAASLAPNGGYFEQYWRLLS